MGLLDLFKTKKRGNKPFDPKFTHHFFKNGGVAVDSSNDENYIKKGHKKNPTVRAIVGMTQRNAGMAKWGVYKQGKDGTKEPYNDTLLKELMYTPNNMMSWNELIQELIGFKMLTGNAYLWGIPSKNRGVVSLYPLPSQDVQIRVAENQRSILGYSFDFYGISEDDVIPYKDVLHLKSFNPEYNEGNDFLYGKSPLEAAYRSLVTNNEMVDTVRAYLNNQGPKGLLSVQEDDGFGELSEEQVKAMNARFRRDHKGSKNAGDVHITAGKWSYTELGSPLADLQLISHYEMTVNDICNVYNFPTLLLGSGESSYANQKEAKKALWSNVIIPILCEIRDGLNGWLSPMYGGNICVDFDISDIKELQEDIDMQANAISKLQNVVTVNEARSMIGLAPLNGPEGDEMYRFVQGTENDRNETESNTERGEGTSSDSE